jgi:SAM-dependent methyltransferase
MDSEYHRALQTIAMLQKENAERETSYQTEIRRLQAEHDRGIAKLTKRLREQLWNTRALSHLLDNVENAAARLRSSRRWNLANPGTAIKAKLFPNKVSVGYGYLEKIVASYLQWRTSHPEIAKIDDQIKMLAFPTTPKSPEIDPANLASVERSQSAEQLLRTTSSLTGLPITAEQEFWKIRMDQASALSCEPGTLCFRCNICGEHCRTALDRLGREESSCKSCRSCARMRAVIRVLSTELFGKSLLLENFPARPDIRGLGMTDWVGYAKTLAEKLSYQNTYYDQEPRLDISAVEIPVHLLANDFVISSEVFEHVVPPVSRAFENVAKMLKPGGLFILTVPYTNKEETIEHFPDLYDFTVVKDHETFVLRNKTREGVIQEFRNLVFHGGPGSTLEMRAFSENSIIQHLRNAGFHAIKIHREPDFAHGVWWPQPWALPISARKSV